MFMKTVFRGAGACAAAAALAGAVGASGASGAMLVQSSSSTLAPSLSGGPVVFIKGNIVVKCTTSGFGLTGLPLTASPLPATFAVSPRPTVAGCTATMAGIPRPVTVTTSGTWSIDLNTTNYAGNLNAPAGGITITVGTCTFSTGAAPVPIWLRDAANAAPALGVAATRLAVVGTGTLPVPAVCNTATSMSMLADGTTVVGSATGTYGLGGSITEF